MEDVPTRRLDETTQPNAAANVQGPTLEAFARLQKGELDSLILVDRYRVDRWLARGGMASIFVGEELATGRAVAVKVLADQDECAHHTLLRFVREASLGSQISHPNVVEVIDWGTTPEGVMYVVMELLEGEDLLRALEHELTLDWPRVRTLMLQLCAAVGAVHRTGIVHRDLKPSNCILVPQPDGSERLVLVDFGIAIPAEVRRRQPGDSAIIGTPEYMAPEQARGAAVDNRTDVYSAGVILFTLLVGRSPLGESSAGQILAWHADAQTDPMRKHDPVMSGLDPRIGRVFARATAKDPRDRYDSMEALGYAIEAIPANCAGRIESSERSARRRHESSSGSWRPTGLVAMLLGLVSLVG